MQRCSYAATARLPPSRGQTMALYVYSATVHHSLGRRRNGPFLPLTEYVPVGGCPAPPLAVWVPDGAVLWCSCWWAPHLLMCVKRLFRFVCTDQKDLGTGRIVSTGRCLSPDWLVAPAPQPIALAPRPPFIWTIH